MRRSLCYGRGAAERREGRSVHLECETAGLVQGGDAMAGGSRGHLPGTQQRQRHNFKMRWKQYKSDRLTEGTAFILMTH